MSVLIASYNHADFIGEGIESIWAQPHRNVEIIVVDDGSLDGSVSLLEDLRDRSPLPFHLIVNPKNMGVTRTLNVALSKAKGELVTALGSDDKFAPDRFGAQLAAFRENLALKAVFGECQTLRENALAEITGPKRKGEVLAQDPQRILHGLYTHKSPFFIQAALLKTAFVREIGGFDEALLSDDWPLVIRIFENVKDKGEYAYVPDVVSYYREHQKNSYKNFDRHSQLKLQVIDKYTPENLKREAYANVHYIISRWALDAKLYGKALHHFYQSQRSGLNFGRMRFITKFMRVLASNAFRNRTRSDSIQNGKNGNRHLGVS
ncbi:MAG: glycosyltransferase [Kiloniellales bacterium]|nr:glycosyltransferase [Kiloniellales bacterium]